MTRCAPRGGVTSREREDALFLNVHSEIFWGGGGEEEVEDEEEEEEEEEEGGVDGTVEERQRACWPLAAAPVW